MLRKRYVVLGDVTRAAEVSRGRTMKGPASGGVAVNAVEGE